MWWRLWLRPEEMMSLASSASESSLINDGESPANDNTRLPRHLVMTIAHGLSQPSINEICIQHQWGAPIFGAPVTLGLISSIHHTRGTRPGKEKGDYFRWTENYWGQVSNDGVTPGLRGCHLTYLYIPGQYFSARVRITAARGQQSAVITHTYLL